MDDVILFFRKKIKLVNKFIAKTSHFTQSKPKTHKSTPRFRLPSLLTLQRCLYQY